MHLLERGDSYSEICSWWKQSMFHCFTHKHIRVCIGFYLLFKPTFKKFEQCLNTNTKPSQIQLLMRELIDCMLPSVHCALLWGMHTREKLLLLYTFFPANGCVVNQQAGCIFHTCALEVMTATQISDLLHLSWFLKGSTATKYTAPPINTSKGVTIFQPSTLARMIMMWWA